MPTHIYTPKLNIYLVANENALNLLDHDYKIHELQDTITKILGRDAQPVTLNFHLKTLLT